jgi:ABC-type antimicrobial peptide transport system permease subunit
MTLTGIGIVLGIPAAMAASSALISLLFGIAQLDSITYLGVIALLLTVSAVACAFPAWRAARVSPLVALRSE